MCMVRLGRLAYQTTQEVKVNTPAFSWAWMFLFFNRLSVLEVLETDPLRVEVDSAVGEAGY